METINHFGSHYVHHADMGAKLSIINQWVTSILKLKHTQQHCVKTLRMQAASESSVTSKDIMSCTVDSLRERGIDTGFITSDNSTQCRMPLGGTENEATSSWRSTKIVSSFPLIIRTNTGFSWHSIISFHTGYLFGDPKVIQYVFVGFSWVHVLGDWLDEMVPTRVQLSRSNKVPVEANCPAFLSKVHEDWHDLNSWWQRNQLWRYQLLVPPKVLKVCTIVAKEDTTIEKMLLKISHLPKMDTIWHTPSIGKGPHFHQNFL